LDQQSLVFSFDLAIKNISIKMM
jgi:hypothetical protein